jgi:hypothetical protein
MNEGSLFCSYEIHHQTRQDTSDSVLGAFPKLSTRRGAWAFGSMTFELAVQKFLNIE